MFWRDLPHKTFRPDWLKSLPVDLINSFAQKYNIDAVLLGAVVRVESNGNTHAIKYEPGFRYSKDVRQLALLIGCSPDTMEVMQKTSWGLMQVMGSTAYDMGLASEKDPNMKWPTALLIPEKGMEYGCIFLKKKIDQYGPEPDNIYASYNAGSVNKTKGGFFINQAQVSKFMSAYRDLGGIY